MTEKLINKLPRKLIYTCFQNNYCHPILKEKINYKVYWQNNVPIAPLTRVDRERSFSALNYVFHKNWNRLTGSLVSN